MSQFFIGAISGAVFAAPFGFFTAALLIGAKSNALKNQRRDEDSMEALIAERIQLEVVRAARLIN